MSDRPYFSICIPAYRNPQHIKRLLDSILIQTYIDYEIIITDDSPENSIASLIGQFQNVLPIHYIKNETPKGSPENWNESIRMAKGQWIKIMHDDDWFTDENSLQEFYQATISDKADFIFSAYNNVYLTENKTEPSKLNWFTKWLLGRHPMILFKKNHIGHPSTTLIKNNLKNWFDPKIKWVVDFEFYLRLLHEKKKFIYIPKALVNIGMGAHQITSEVFRKKEVEIPENLYLLNLIGFSGLKNIFIYDYYWRLIRNLDITDVATLKSFSVGNKVPLVIEKMISLQKKTGNRKLKTNRYLSKALMTLQYLMLIMTFNDFSRESK